MNTFHDAKKLFINLFDDHLILILFWLISNPETATPPAFAPLPGPNKVPEFLKHRHSFRIRRHICSFTNCYYSIFDKVFRVITIYLILSCAWQSDITFNSPRSFTIIVLTIKFIGVLFDTSSFIIFKINNPMLVFLYLYLLDQIKPEESDKVITLPPSCITFSVAYWATLPEPETKHFYPLLNYYYALTFHSTK